MHDGRRHDWEAGDLMIVPPYSMHQHFCDEGPAILIYCQAGHGPNVDVGAAAQQQEMHEGWVLPEDARPLYGQDGAMVGYQRGDLRYVFRCDLGLVVELPDAVPGLLVCDVGRQLGEQHDGVTGGGQR